MESGNSETTTNTEPSVDSTNENVPDANSQEQSEGVPVSNSQEQSEAHNPEPTQYPACGIEPALESNISVIENQNNENLERDNENMQATQVQSDSTEPLEPKEPEPLQENSEPVQENPEPAQEDPEEHSSKDLVPPSDVEDIPPPPPIEEQCSSTSFELLDSSIGTSLDTEPVESEETQIAPTEEPEPQVAQTSTSEVTPTEEQDASESKKQIKDSDLSISQENEQSQKVCEEASEVKEISQEDTPQELDSNLENSDSSSVSKEPNVSKEPSVSEEPSVTEQSDDKSETENPLNTENIEAPKLTDHDTNEETVNEPSSSEEKPEEKPEESIELKEPEPAVLQDNNKEKDLDKEVSLSEEGDVSNVAEKDEEKDKEKNKEKDEEKVQTEEPLQSKTQDSQQSTDSADIITKDQSEPSTSAETTNLNVQDKDLTNEIHDESSAPKNIEFAQVNFDIPSQVDGPDIERDDADKFDSTSKTTVTTDVDPIAASNAIEDIDPIEENREGADEELCIIPDTDRDLPHNAAAASVTEEPGLRVKSFVGAESSTSAPKESNALAFVRKCASCKKTTDDIDTNLTWEIMDFCNEFCLSKYQREVGAKCSSCQSNVKSTSLGKYCVRFGNDIRQFCTSVCLEQYKKGLKVCSYCQKDMSNGSDGFLAPIGRGQFKDFCSQSCMDKYDVMTNDRPPKVPTGTICSVCKAEKPITIEFEYDGAPNYFCGDPCFVAFSFVNNISTGKCAMCRRQFNKSTLEEHMMHYDNAQLSFCSNSCQNIYIIAHRKIVPCSWCKVKKYNFDMIKKYNKDGEVVNMCSINCLSLFQVSMNAVNARKITCNNCQKSAHPLYHLTMSDATIRNFCSYNCVMGFQNQFPKQPLTLNNIGDTGFPVPTGAPKKNKKFPTPEINNGITDGPLPVISSVQSLAVQNSFTPPPSIPPPMTNSRLTRSKAHSAHNAAPAPAPAPVTNGTPNLPGLVPITEIPTQVQIKHHYIVKPPPMPAQRNVSTMCCPRKAVKSIEAKPSVCDKGIQTERGEASKILLPVPVPIYVPTPCHMFTVPVPMPVPFPLPIPIPIFIPTTRNSAAGIMKEIKKIQVKIPTDPYEAELLMMAEMVAEEKKEENTDSESDIDDAGGNEGGEYSPEPVDASNTFGDDMLQMALKMATELDEPAVDLEGALTANTITAQQGGHQEPPEENVDDPMPVHPHMMERGRKRNMRGAPRAQPKRGRRMSHHQVDMPMMSQVQQTPPAPEPQEKPDANMCLKYTFGVNAWKQWVTTKNAELEKSSRRVKLFKTEILQLTADELNYSLCLFVKEVRKPNGQEYAPDTIYYLCLGIQQYLFENGRIDNIFCDPYYEKFTDCLDEVARKFSVLYNDSHYIVTRVEEEHLWESKQLGAHSPHVLLSTLMFFNTKHFNLTTVDEHMQLSFSHIMKHWKRNPNQPGAAKVPGSRNVLLRFYPPQSALQNNHRKKKVYEQQENEENPLRCPVKLYEFYLSKCPESVKTRNDVFYLQPERSCVPDSPVWYSTMPLPKEALEKMLHRVKMVKEINVALLTS